MKEMATVKKDRHEYSKWSIGGSDIARLIASGPDKVDFIRFGSDGYYEAYLVDKNCEIPDFYELRFETTHWITIYDDSDMTFSAYADEIKVYRAKEMGCIIQLIAHERKPVLIRPAI